MTRSPERPRQLGELLGREINVVPAPVPDEPARAPFDALCATWLPVSDAVVLDVASLGETARWAIESLAGQPAAATGPVVVYANADQPPGCPFPPEWLVVRDADPADQRDRAVRQFFELCQARERLAALDRLVVQPRPAVTATPADVDSRAYRYREALKSVSFLLGQRADQASLLAEFTRLLRDLLGLGKLALFIRPFGHDLFGEPPRPEGESLAMVCRTGISQTMAEHVRLSLRSGLGSLLQRDARILQRGSLAVNPVSAAEAAAVRELELLGTDVAVPMFDNDQLLGVLVFGSRITGEPWTSDELELIYHLLAHLAQALRNLQLARQIDGQRCFMSEILAHVQSGVLILSADNRVLTINQRARELLGLGPEPWVGRPATGLPSRVTDPMAEALQTGQAVTQRAVILPSQNRSLSISASVVPAAAGRVTVALIEDQTEQQSRQARERDQADKEFFERVAYRLSHELKNALVPVKTLTQLLPTEWKKAEFRDQFGTMVGHGVGRVVQLVDNLTFFAQSRALGYEQVALEALLDTCVHNVGQEFARKKIAQLTLVGAAPADPELDLPAITVKRSLGHKAGWVEADRIRLIQVLENVLRNAVQAMPTGGRLMLSTADAVPGDFPDGQLPAGGGVRIEVKDSGEGIPLENLSRVTEPFFTTR
ncbi:GAF domain-containing protein, partial [bacterium]|nr:GAF domain-containing protein [bacterium]